MGGPFFSPFYLLLKHHVHEHMIVWPILQIVPVNQQQISFTLIVAPQPPVGENPWIDSGHFGGNPCSLMGKTMGKPVFISFNPRTWIQHDTTIAAIALFTAPSTPCWSEWLLDLFLGHFHQDFLAETQRCQPTHWGAPLWEGHFWDQKRHWFFW